MRNILVEMMLLCVRSIFFGVLVIGWVSMVCFDYYGYWCEFIGIISIYVIVYFFFVCFDSFNGVFFFNFYDFI